MKKLAVVLMAALFVFGLVGPAAAAITTGDLVLSIYEPNATSGIEKGVSLGAYNQGGTDLLLAASGSFNFGSDFGTAPRSDLFAGVWAMDSSTNTFLYGKTNANKTVFGPGFSGFVSGATDVYGSNNSPYTGSSYAGATYSNLLIADNAGDYALINLDFAAGEANLGGSYMDAYGTVIGTLYIHGFNAGSEIASNFDAIKIYEDGSVRQNPVPVPAAVWLLGTGLVGLIGIRRRNG